LREYAILTRKPVSADHRDHAWKETVAEAMSESNPENLPAKIAAAEAAIFERLQVLVTKSDSRSAEVRELREASQALLALKTNVLKFPDWRQE
jgi:hypothetical protein